MRPPGRRNEDKNPRQGLARRKNSLRFINSSVGSKRLRHLVHNVHNVNNTVNTWKSLSKGEHVELWRHDSVLGKQSSIKSPKAHRMFGRDEIAHKDTTGFTSTRFQRSEMFGESEIFVGRRFGSVFAHV